MGGFVLEGLSVLSHNRLRGMLREPLHQRTERLAP